MVCLQEGPYNPMINETFERFRSEVAGILDELRDIIADIQNPQLEIVINDIRTHVMEPFLFVVVGEIKSGKSSFVNALLNAEVCRVDPAPCTDTIQQLVYAPERTENQISPYFYRIGMPIDILKHIAIVDTPGTNTVITHHHEITERFIPNSGLVLFVFPAKNPHTLSAWNLLDYVSEEWRKRVVFILQQADLTTDEELRVNRSKVEEYAIARGIDAPRIFIASAKWEKENDPRSGFEEIRTFIRETVTGGRHFYLKLKSDLETGENVLKKVHNALDLLQKELEADKIAAQRLHQVLLEGRETALKDIRHWVDRMLEQYDQATEQIKIDFSDGFSMPSLFARSIRSAFSQRDSVRSWLEDLQTRFEGRLNTSIEPIAGNAAMHFMMSFRDLTDRVLKALRHTDSHEKGHVEMTIDLDDHRDRVISEIRNQARELAAMNFAAETLTANPAGMSSRLISGSALTIVGTILLTTHVTLLDITGGILTGIGLLMASSVLLIKKGKVIQELKRALQEGRERLEKDLIEKLSAQITQVHEKLGRSVVPFFDNVSDRENKIQPLMARAESLQKKMGDLLSRIDAATAS
jgi:GTPase SAR1 family protein